MPPSSVYRAKRFDLSFPLVFDERGTLSKGHCLNLSESGLLANFSPALDLWVMGNLLFEIAQNRVIVPARVARVDGREAGLSFSFINEAQREAVRDLVRFAEERTHLRGAAPPF